MPIAAWAKFTTPDVRCDSTRPSASEAMTAPLPSPASR